MSADKPGHSLERDLRIGFFLVVLIISILAYVAYYESPVSAKVAITLYVAFMLLFIPYLLRLGRRVVTPLDNLANVVESIRLEDYGFTSRSTYKHGVIAHLLNETSDLVNSLQLRKDRYAQHVYLIYKLIEQLDSPVLVFDQDLRLSHANAAFGDWYGQPWRTVRLMSSERLGLLRSPEGNWQFKKPGDHVDWQIKHSRFLDDSDQYQLVILNNIVREVRQVQQESWQQLIRVLSHEIRNSLTPIRSMAQLMIETPGLDESFRTPLEVIQARSVSLQDFVKRFANSSKSYTLTHSQITPDKLMDKIIPLFPDANIRIDATDASVWADPVLLEQVLINLIRNATEAQTSSNPEETIVVSFRITKQHCEIQIKDRGRGVANPSNLFVPFYTTKEGGQGIGLVFCRNIIEQHGGTLRLTNRELGGAKAIINLPLPA